MDAGIPLAEACRVLADEYKSRERLFASFGDYDRSSSSAIAPRSASHTRSARRTSTSRTWRPSLMAGRGEVGMSEALKRVGLPLEGTHHRGGDDAWNIAEILSRVLWSSRVG